MPAGEMCTSHKRTHTHTHTHNHLLHSCVFEQCRLCAHVVNGFLFYWNRTYEKTHEHSTHSLIGRCVRVWVWAMGHKRNQQHKCMRPNGSYERNETETCKLARENQTFWPKSSERVSETHERTRAQSQRTRIIDRRLLFVFFLLYVLCPFLLLEPKIWMSINFDE